MTDTTAHKITDPTATAEGDTGTGVTGPAGPADTAGGDASPTGARERRQPNDVVRA